MHCDHAHDWLLQTEQPGAIDKAPADVVSHLRQCGSCRRLSRRLERLEQTYHDTPIPASVDRARAAFLASLDEEPAISVRKTRTALPPRRSALRWALAASVLFVVATAVLMFWPGSQVQASADLVDRLVDWNLELAQAPSGSERDRIFADHRDRLTGELGKVRLPDADRQLAESLVATLRGSAPMTTRWKRPSASTAWPTSFLPSCAWPLTATTERQPTGSLAPTTV